jgi:hypothetical protein
MYEGSVCLDGWVRGGFERELGRGLVVMGKGRFISLRSQPSSRVHTPTESSPPHPSGVVAFLIAMMMGILIRVFFEQSFRKRVEG